MNRILFLFIALSFALNTWATDFTADGVAYTITDAANNTVALGTDSTAAAISISTSGAFTIPSSVTDNSITYSVTSIGNYAFWGCSGLTSITIPSSVTSIGKVAFGSCFITSLTIPSSVTFIGDLAFHFSWLTSITIPSSVTLIGESITRDCGFLTSITVDNNNPNYSSSNGVLFNKSKTELIQYPAGKTVTSYTIPSSVTSVGKYAFWNCPKLTSITIPSSVTSIANNAFYECFGLTSITIPSSVTSIGAGAFGYCFDLTSVTIGTSVTSIGNYAFSGCNSLPSIFIPSSVVSIGIDVFECSSLTSITVDNNNPNYSSSNDVLFNKSQTYLIQFPAGKTTTSYIIPSSVTYIDSYAFYRCSGLTSVTIPSSVTHIGDDAFRSCSSLTSMHANNTNPANITLGGGLFQNVPTSSCILHVPAGSKSFYQAAAQWGSFTTIEEETLVSFGPSADDTTVNVTSTVKWLATSNQTWLTVSPSDSITGNAAITLTAEANTSTKARTATVKVSAKGITLQTITITQQGIPTGVEIVYTKNISVYPNPAINTLYITNYNDFTKYAIYDLTGKQVISGNITHNPIDVSKLKQGIYLIKATSQQGTYTSRFLKQ